MAFEASLSMSERIMPGIEAGKDFEGWFAKDFDFRTRFPLPWNLDKFRPEDVPPEAFLQSSHRFIADVVAFDARLLVCPEFKALVERLEPGQHDFFPVRIRRPRSSKPIHRLDKVTPVAEYYLFSPQVGLDAIRIEASEVKVIGEGPTQMVQADGSRVFNFGPPARIVLDKAKVTGHHVWVGRWHMPQARFVSDELHAQVVAAGFKGLNFIHCPEM